MILTCMAFAAGAEAARPLSLVALIMVEDWLVVVASAQELVFKGVQMLLPSSSTVHSACMELSPSARPLPTASREPRAASDSASTSLA